MNQIFIMDFFLHIKNIIFKYSIGQINNRIKNLPQTDLFSKCFLLIFDLS